MNPTVRLLDIPSFKRSSHEMELIGVDPFGISIMSPKHLHFNLKIRDLTCAQANIIKQEMLSVGGEAAVAGGVVSCKVKVSDAIVSGTYKQLDKVIEKLRMQPFALSDVGNAIDRAISSSLSNELTLECRDNKWQLNDRTLIMGILNVTPDSFSDGGEYLEKEKAVSRAISMIEQGADIVDVGGESTRPGSVPVSPEIELDRVVPVVEELAGLGVPVSVDTMKAEVAESALKAGACMINDVSGMSADERMGRICAEYGAGIIIMHMRGTPLSMQDHTEYDDIITEVYDHLHERFKYALACGIMSSRIAIDPGLGFGKSVDGNLRLINRLSEFKSLGAPVVLGTSRKSFIGKTLSASIGERIEGTAATVAIGIVNGANIIRVHDVAQMRRVADMANAIISSGNGARQLY